MAAPLDEIVNGLGLENTRMAFDGTLVGHREPLLRAPVIRCFGSTPAGQKATLHLHDCWPYFYVLWPEPLPEKEEDTDRLIHVFGSAVERAVEVKTPEPLNDTLRESFLKLIFWAHAGLR